MGEFEDRLNSLLNDPGQMEKLMGVAQSLMGAQNAPQQAEPGRTNTDMGLGELLNPAMLGRLAGVMSGGQDHGRNRVLLEAMKPYLSPKRQEKLGRAMELARMIHMAELAYGVFGEGGNAKI